MIFTPSGKKHLKAKLTKRDGVIGVQFVLKENNKISKKRSEYVD